MGTEAAADLEPPAPSAVSQIAAETGLNQTAAETGLNQLRGSFCQG